MTRGGYTGLESEPAAGVPCLLAQLGQAQPSVDPGSAFPPPLVMNQSAHEASLPLSSAEQRMDVGQKLPLMVFFAARPGLSSMAA